MISTGQLHTGARAPARGIAATVVAPVVAVAAAIAGAVGSRARARIRPPGWDVSPDAIALVAFEHCPGGIAVLDRAGVVRAVNPTLARWCGASAPCLAGGDLGDLVHVDDRAALSALVGAAESRAGVEVRLSGGDQPWVRLAIVHVAPTPARAGMCVIQVEDAGAQRAATARLAHDAAHDALTGLPNRRALTVALADLIDDPGPGGALVVIDLDGFKAINDHHGHTGGDELLVIVAQRLVSALRPGDVAGRLGGDELMVIARGVVDDAGARALARRVLDAVIGPARLAGASVALRASVGARRIAPGEDDALALVRDADAALYRAKAAGGCCARLAHAGEGNQVTPASCDLPAA